MLVPFVYSIHRQYSGLGGRCTSAPLHLAYPHVRLGEQSPTATCSPSLPLSPCRLGVQNQASISSLWALCADILDAEAGTRLFGFIGAGKKGVGADGPL